MTKGRGSNQRRRTGRQRYASWVARLPAGDPDAIAYDEAKAIRMWGRRNPDNYVRTAHPLERER